MGQDNTSSESKRLRQLTTFNEIGKALTSTLDLNEVLNVVLEKISGLLKPNNWSLLLIDEEKDELYFEIAVGEKADRIKGLRLKIGEGIAGWVAKEGVPLSVPDVSKDERFCKKVDESSRFVTKSVVCVPLKSKGKVLGVIEFINKVEEGGSGEENLLLLTTLADYTAIAIENAKYLQRVEELSIMDDLTKLYNQRYLYQSLGYEVERAKRYNSSVAMIFFDIDQFKEVNDAYGHLCGSKVLVEVGGLVIKNLRRIDVACRYGGDEFIIIMPQAFKYQAYILAQRLRRLINNHVFLKGEGINLHLTASFGVASFPEDARDKVELIHMADKAMYRVKSHTKNGIGMADPLPTAP
ncbi:MAG: sensor domain-containing diguanylate cyclase [Deltaproteobacteria bacterium]|nr:sensor domain-containing diguanylate cyclase [Deltaproteobacteria bacterium]